MPSFHHFSRLSCDSSTWLSFLCFCFSLSWKCLHQPIRLFVFCRRWVATLRDNEMKIMFLIIGTKCTKPPLPSISILKWRASGVVIIWVYRISCGVRFPSNKIPLLITNAVLQRGSLVQVSIIRLIVVQIRKPYHWRLEVWVPCNTRSLSLTKCTWLLERQIERRLLDSCFI